MIENGLLTVEQENDTIISDVYLFTSTKFKGDVTESNGNILFLFFFAIIIVRAYIEAKCRLVNGDNTDKLYLEV